ncbi:MAG: stringent starvation protein SspA [Pseudomonadota bacterium]|jgi:RNA polymerase-associated protein|uniref:Stringent starvation protein A n=2 Tax=Alteromonas TaxID=226 RepID=A0A2S9V4N8_9ALTE|nr:MULTISPECIES: stringent starvation protein SspA [Alteromonas]MAD10782.1 stringent starvation protein A [Alteromonas sp.]MBR9793215.1 stringent starvation protein A [Gammaproteobacteria bacterium]MDG6098046.1 stringent starvation protein A [Alteromonas sp. ZYF713]MDY6928988.1 stringent starvation protein SspA [Pseudomonadota bacterium]MCP4864731.1 stringent starvation protein A [Alteromonas sp.]|tara:strand:- start:1476 stop:2108 length:633 start_codon:yes stop_codon:yes gene_type:complete
MAVAANKRSIMTLFSDTIDIYSHQVRIVLAEKGVGVEISYTDPTKLPEDLMELNPYGTVPTLVDRELVLYKSHIIMEYLDERFPHPPLMPVYPVSRGQSRLMMHRIEQDWYSLAAQIFRGEGDVETARNDLREALLSLAPVFAEMPYFMSEEFSLVDCYLAPLLWRLPALGIELNGGGAKDIHAYMNRIFSRSSFKASLTDQEREIHNPL